MDGWMIDKWMNDGGINGWVDELLDGCTDGCVDGVIIWKMEERQKNRGMDREDCHQMS